MFIIDNARYWPNMTAHFAHMIKLNATSKKSID